MELTKEFYTFSELCIILCESRQTLVKWRKAGVMKAGRIGTGKARWQVNRQEVERLIRQQGGQFE